MSPDAFAAFVTIGFSGSDVFAAVFGVNVVVVVAAQVDGFQPVSVAVGDVDT